MPNKTERIRRSQLACPHCGTHKISVRDTVAKGSRIIERYRFCEACNRLSKTREQFVSDYQEYPRKIPESRFQ